MAWDWYEWPDKESFDIWHEQIKASLGLPKLSIDSNGQECEPLVTEYTEGIISQDKVIAMVEDIYAESLRPTELRPPRPKHDLA
jgi:hypothetical protein